MGVAGCWDACWYQVWGGKGVVVVVVVVVVVAANVVGARVDDVVELVCRWRGYAKW